MRFQCGVCVCGLVADVWRADPGIYQGWILVEGQVFSVLLDLGSRKHEGQLGGDGIGEGIIKSFLDVNFFSGLDY